MDKGSIEKEREKDSTIMVKAQATTNPRRERVVKYPPRFECKFDESFVVSQRNNEIETKQTTSQMTRQIIPSF
jgi:hypothetical protein